jgi:ubiquinone/menaquinone biosynthesis C-methylase UbiE/DNA-binding transcriptional ArsR family regulator
MNGSLPTTRNGHRALDHSNGSLPFIELLRTMADPVRLRIVRLLEQPVHHGLSVGELAAILKLPQSTMSRHLKTLTDASLAAVKREGTSMVYRLSDEAANGQIKQLRLLARQHLDADALAKADVHRLAAILRRRQNAGEKFFGKSAAQWDHIRRQWFGETFHLEAMLALLNPTWVVADLGTGTGAMLPLLAPHVGEVIAVDPSPAMLRGAKARVQDGNLKNVTLRQGTIEQLPIESATLDVALLSLVMHHIVDPAAALREIRRTLKSGKSRGVLLIVDLQPHAVEMFRTDMGHRWMGFSESQLRDWLAAAGFADVRWHSLPAKAGRSKEEGTAVPDLFALRAEAA